MKYTVRYVFLFFFILSFVFLIPGLHSNQRQEKSQELRHEVAVTLKLIQVYVTDKKGNPVLDLKKEDFIIRDNGKEKTITEFERQIWANFWNIANDPQLSASMGIRAAHGVAPAIRLRSNKRYRVTLRASDGLTVVRVEVAERKDNRSPA